MSCMHVLMQRGYSLCMHNFYRINSPKSTVIFIGTVGILPLRINAAAAPLQNSWSRYISGAQSGQCEVYSILESNTL
jgi:hypothetical protein